MICLANGTPSSELTGDGWNSRLDVQEVKQLVAEGKLMELPNSEKILFRPASAACSGGSSEQTPRAIREAAGRQAGENLRVAAAETVGDGLCAQGSSTLGRKYDSGTVTVILLVGWLG